MTDRARARSAPGELPRVSHPGDLAPGAVLCSPPGLTSPGSVAPRARADLAPTLGTNSTVGPELQALAEVRPARRVRRPARCGPAERCGQAAGPPLAPSAVGPASGPSILKSRRGARPAEGRILKSRAARPRQAQAIVKNRAVCRTNLLPLVQCQSVAPGAGGDQKGGSVRWP